MTYKYETKEKCFEALSRGIYFADPVYDLFRDDHEVALMAVQRKVSYVKSVGKKLSKDRKFGVDAVSKRWGALEFLPEKLRLDREVVKAALVSNGMALQFVSKSLRADKELVLLAVSSCGEMLSFVDVELRGDRDVQLAAVSQDAMSVKHIEGGAVDLEVAYAAAKTALKSERYPSILPKLMGVRWQRLHESCGRDFNLFVKKIEEKLLLRKKMGIKKVVVSDSDFGIGEKSQKKSLKV